MGNVGPRGPEPHPPPLLARGSFRSSVAIPGLHLSWDGGRRGLAVLRPKRFSGPTAAREGGPDATPRLRGREGGVAGPRTPAPARRTTGDRGPPIFSPRVGGRACHGPVGSGGAGKGSGCRGPSAGPRSRCLPFHRPRRGSGAPPTGSQPRLSMPSATDGW